MFNSFKKLKCIVCLCLLNVVLSGQVSTRKIVVEGYVYDLELKQPIPFANIYEPNKKIGTLSNPSGFFRIENLAPDDSLRISFIGYEGIVVNVSENFPDTLWISSKSEQLSEVLIYDDQSFIYNLLARARKSYSNSNRTAKTYLSHASYVDDHRVEMLEAYYNGEIRGYDLKKLNFKNGRIALSDYNNRFFLSTETTIALCQHSSLKSNSLFPRSPLELSTKKLKKNFNVQLLGTYKNSINHPIYILEFEPKNEASDFFNAKIFLDSASAQILSIDLQKVKAKVHPFIPIAHVDSLLKVDLLINKTFENIDGSSFLRSINFSYQLFYKSLKGKNYNVKSEAIMYVYDYENQFVLPFFEFSEGTASDYRKINASPYNTSFWNLIDEFSLKDDPTKNQEFISKGASIDNRSLFSANEYFDHGFFEHPYIFWSEKRIIFKKNEKTKNPHQIVKPAVMPKDRYNYEVQLYLDYNHFNDSVNITTTTVFDPYKTFSFLPDSAYTHAFANMYFDLMEIEKRNLDIQILKNPKDVHTIKTLYQQSKIDCALVSRLFFKDCQRGTNFKGMQKWNEVIKKELNIDNLALFRLE